MIFDLGDQQSFSDIVTYWMNEVYSYSAEHSLKILVGNKADSPTRAVDEPTIMQFVK